MSTKNKQPNTKKQSTSTTQLVMASTLTQSTEIAIALPTTAATTLDACPDEILLHIAMYVGAHSCYLGYGVVNKRLNHLFKTYSTKLSKSTSYGGYAPFQEIVQRCEKELEKKIVYYHWWDIPGIFQQLASGAVTFNRTDLLEWAIEKQNKFLHRALCVRAIKDKKLSIFQKVWNSIGNENMMTYMKQQTWFIHIAVEKGYLNWLIYLREELECEWNKYACDWAAMNGHVDCLVYLHEHGCEWNNEACYKAAGGGHLDCLVYLHEHGCEWNSGACREAAGGGHLDCLVYLHEHGCPWNWRACREAAGGGHVDCLVYLHEHGCPWNWKVCRAAARWGQLDCLVYLHEHGCPWNSDACSEAARCGHVDCLVYLHEHGCEWNSDACREAARWGQLDCLVYLHEHGCEWNWRACHAAAYHGHLDCLRYMRDNGLEWDRYDEYLGNKVKDSDP